MRGSRIEYLRKMTEIEGVNIKDFIIIDIDEKWEVFERVLK